MKTKKVFISYKIIFLGFSFSALLLVSGFHPINKIMLVCGFSFLIAALYSSYFRIKPFYTYNDKVLIFGWRTDKINWKDIVSVKTDEFFGRTFISSNKGHLIPMSFMTTPNFRQVLREVVELIKRKNPNAKIDRATIEKLK